MRLDLYLFGCMALLLTEYGVRSRKTALAAFEGRWPWRRTALRAALWVAFFALPGWLRAPRGIILLLIAIAVGELSAWVLRIAVRRTIAGGHAHGLPWTHVLAFLLPAVLPAALGSLSFFSRIGPRYNVAWIAGVTAALALWTWATLLTVSVVELVRPDQVEEAIRPMFGAGEVIGLLERYLAFALVLFGGLAAIGFVIAAKAAVRYPQFKKREFAEYFLIGTLTSVGVALLAGLALRGLL